ncbi:hypothetical protein WJX73_000403 [Symbiochloris irregularis]|uniref:Uncharacterized protein n=1 Tax=Symbiochloris irregularis TaxID=706552 RepID=A0AAW1NV18_9CHLO
MPCKAARGYSSPQSYRASSQSTPQGGGGRDGGSLPWGDLAGAKVPSEQRTSAGSAHSIWRELLLSSSTGNTSGLSWRSFCLRADIPCPGMATRTRCERGERIYQQRKGGRTSNSGQRGPHLLGTFSPPRPYASPGSPTRPSPRQPGRHQQDHEGAPDRPGAAASSRCHGQPEKASPQQWKGETAHLPGNLGPPCWRCTAPELQIYPTPGCQNACQSVGKRGIVW